MLENQCDRRLRCGDRLPRSRLEAPVPFVRRSRGFGESGAIRTSRRPLGIVVPGAPEDPLLGRDLPCEGQAGAALDVASGFVIGKCCARGAG